MSESRQRKQFWLLSIATLVAVGVTLSLGRWQLSRAAEKAQLQASIEAKGKLPVLDASALVDALVTDTAPIPVDQALLHRQVVLHGRWVAEKTVFLDNRQMNAKPGFYVVTPLQLAQRTEVVLVQRGWVARNFVDRTQLPVIETPAGAVTVAGRIVPPPSKLYELGAADSGTIRQNLDLVQFREETRLPLHALSIQQQGAPSEGLLRAWPQVASGIEKHDGYAFQWFGLSALITLLYVWFQIVRRFIAPQPR